MACTYKKYLYCHKQTKHASQPYFHHYYFENKDTNKLIFELLRFEGFILYNFLIILLLLYLQFEIFMYKFP